MLSGNKVKIIACITMLIDHIGLFLLPDIPWLRSVGRIAFPLFAFFIAEGCRYTRNRKRYFLNVFTLAVLCQLVYFAEIFINGAPDEMYLNVLFTFSLSIIVCSAFFAFRDALIKMKGLVSVLINGAVFVTASFFSVFICVILEENFTVSYRIEYGIVGVFLPLFASLFSNRWLKLAGFFAGVLLFVAVLGEDMNIYCFALLSVPIVALYNGKRGKAKLKYAFYLFYPVQFGVLYIISMLVN